MSRLGAAHGRKRNRPVERREPAAVFHG